MRHHGNRSIAPALLVLGFILTPGWTVVEANPNPATRKLNHDTGGWDVLDFKISPNGAWVVFHTDDYGGAGLEALYSVPADGSSAPVMLYAQTSGAALAMHEYRISGDNSRVVFWGDIVSDGVNELFSIAIDGSDAAVRLNDNLGGWDVLEFQISPNGAWVVYHTDDYGGAGLEALYSVPTNRSFPPALLYAQTSGAALAMHDFKISGDSSRVVYRGDTQTNGVDELFSIPINGGGSTVKLNHNLGGWDVLDFEVSRDGNWVVYHTDDFGGSGLEALYSVPTDDSAPPEMLYAQTSGAALGMSEYRLTADSARVVYYGDTIINGVDELFSIPIDGSGPAVKLNNNTGGWDVLDFQISPDGHWVVYMADDYGGAGLEALYAVPADRSATPEMLYAQTSGASLGIHEYQVTGDSDRVVYRGDTLMNGVDELFSIPIDGSGPAVKLNNNTGGWDVLDFLNTPDGHWVVYMADDYGGAGLEALYAVPADRSGTPEMLYAQNSGAALGIHEYQVTGDSDRVVYRGDIEVDGVMELFSVDLVQGTEIFDDGFESGDLSAWSWVVP